MAQPYFNLQLNMTPWNEILRDYHPSRKEDYQQTIMREGNVSASLRVIYRWISPVKECTFCDSFFNF